MPTSAFVGTYLPRSQVRIDSWRRKQVPLDRFPFTWDWLAPLRLAKTLPIAHESLPSIQLRPLPMIERFGQFLLPGQLSHKREGVRNTLRGACRRMRPDHERSVSHQDRAVEDELRTGQIHNRLHERLVRRSQQLFEGGR